MRFSTSAFLALSCGLASIGLAASEVAINFAVRLDSAAGVKHIQEGRAYVFLSTRNDTEPRFTIGDGQDTQQIFGQDVHDFSAGTSVVYFNQSTSGIIGFPRAIDDVPAGEFYVQAVFLPYTQFNRTVEESQEKLPTVWYPSFTQLAASSEGSLLNGPGVIYGDMTLMTINASTVTKLTELVATKVVPESDISWPKTPPDTEYIKHLTYRSERLSSFWGTDVYLQACVLLPEGWDDKPNVKYPLFIYHGHYHPDFATPNYWSDQPPKDPSSYSTPYDYEQALYAYYMYKNWTDLSEGSMFYKSRGLVMTIKHPTPLYDDSYAVNSESQGPYGDAITFELIPAVESRFRAIGEPWARTVYGGSTGGWESLAVQVFYPDDYNGCWSSCPDPITFEAFSTVNIYEESNAYVYDSFWKRTERPEQRDEAGNEIFPGYGKPFGRITSTMREANIKEAALGMKGRSGGQYDIWEAVFSPVGEDGYIRRIWDKITGVIDKDTANYWSENYDLKHILEKNWDFLGPKLVNKIHIYVGSSDTYYLNNAVYLMEDFLEKTSPYYNGTIQYGVHDGRGFEHCWSGAYNLPNSISRLVEEQRIVPLMAEHIVNNAPPGADITSWRY